MTAVAVQSTTRLSNLQQATQRVAHIDLRMVCMKLADPVEGKGWDDATLQAVERDYRRFLILNLLYPELPVVPNQPVDTMWHAHILDTHAYSADCDRVFGGYLHHFPYFGMRGADDAADLQQAGQLTDELYSATFGIDSAMGAEALATCKRTSCKPQKCR